MEFFRDTSIDFMKYRKVFMIVSVALLLISVLSVFVTGDLNLGVDFAGGTQVTVKFQEPQEINTLRAMAADWGMAEAWSKLMDSGFGLNMLSGAQTHSAKPPHLPKTSPYTASPGPKRVTPGPTVSTVPATSDPRIGILGLKNLQIRPYSGLPLRISQSDAFSDVARTRIRTSPSAGTGLSTSTRSSTSGGPYT